MRTTLIGCLVFAASTVLSGVISLMWHDADTWQVSFKILSLPFGTVIGDCLMVALIAGGIGVLFPRTDRVASVVLIVVYSLLTLAGVPSIIAAPSTYGPYVGFFEELTMVCGAIALYAATEADAAQSAKLGRVARVGLGVCAVSFMLAQIFYLHFTATLVPAWIPPNQMFWAVLTTVAFGLAAVAILINRQARLATRLMTLMLALFGLLIWVPAVVTHPDAHGNWSEFALNFQITGAAWIVAYLRSF